MLSTVTWIWDDYEKKFKELRSVVLLTDANEQKVTKSNQRDHKNYLKHFVKH